MFGRFRLKKGAGDARAKGHMIESRANNDKRKAIKVRERRATMTHKTLRASPTVEIVPQRKRMAATFPIPRVLRPGVILAKPVRVP